MGQKKGHIKYFYQICILMIVFYLSLNIFINIIPKPLFKHLTMKNKLSKSILCFAVALLTATGSIFAQAAPQTAPQTTPPATSFTLTLDPAVNGTYKVTPAPGTDGKYATGTVVTVTATPATGYVLDAIYNILATGRGVYMESMVSPAKITVDKDLKIGASFIEASAVAHINVTQDVVYAKPGVKTLKYDVFSPKGAKNLPIIVIIHGGGWTSNTEDIMRGLARELTKGGQYVVCSIDYRWAQKRDGDATNNTMANLIEDVYGAVAHIMEHAAEYGGDPTKIGLTGDSAGGHLSAACSVMPNKIGSGGFGKTPGVFEYMPSYMPKNKTVAQVRTEMMTAIKAAAPSYGVFSGTLLNTYMEDTTSTKLKKEAISPINNVPKATKRSVPQYLTRGTNDGLIKDEAVKAYVDTLVKRGQTVEYTQLGGAGHAFFDWKPDERTKATFMKYGVYYAAEMKAFFNSVFYKKE
jgi:acetyl esterase